MGGGAKICWHCLVWHRQAMMVLAGQPPQCCQECGITFERLQHLAPDGNVSMYVHQKDGIYQLLCRNCSDAYERKRLDLYGDTRYGEAKKLKGSR